MSAHAVETKLFNQLVYGFDVLFALECSVLEAYTMEQKCYTLMVTDEN